MAVLTETQFLFAFLAPYLCIIYAIVEFVFGIITYVPLITKIGLALCLVSVSMSVISFPTFAQLKHLQLTLSKILTN